LDVIRLNFFEAACNNNLGLIFTFVYAKGLDDGFMNKIESIANTSNTPLFFIQITCDESVLKDRIQSESRAEHDKVRDFAMVQETMKTYDLLSSYSNSDNHLVLDTTDIQPFETANKILQFIYK
jgi:deoxyadenosine/deoxycytidine kinase